MDIKIELEKWSIKTEEKSNAPTIVGEYNVRMNGKTIASQSFNGDYSSMKIPFSNDLTQKLMSLEKEIVDELMTLIK